MLISVPYVLDAADENIVANFLKKPPAEIVGAYWVSDEAKIFKGKAKAYYIKIQENRCCYCMRQVDTNNHKLWDLEHIVSRDARPKFMFTPNNLAVSCADCNTAKRETNVLTNEQAVQFPKASNSFKIVHPALDNYDDHIGIIGGLIYYSKDSKKGTFTIATCNLARFAAFFESRKNNVCDDRYLKQVGEICLAKDKAAAKVIAQEILSKYDIIE